jgi:hypothetical protein
MHQLKEADRDIFETSANWGEGMTRLAQWFVQAETTFQHSGATVDR